ncbi:hypothetical protein M9H77_18604 [Catharanthus roseus]|uniref:Uncharacterized protein n=1 Tax=Catharanthus roseus TaxID=4058 RepID=A0ACC0B7W9_CATRO|nr:hypothetical protein M9H77_18604 [Catharanthus roseus]
MTRDAKATIEFMKGAITRARAKKMDGDLNIEDLEDGMEASKLFLVSIVQKKDINCTMGKHEKLVLLMGCVVELKDGAMASMEEILSRR